jgi:hypothetical protein
MSPAFTYVGHLPEHIVGLEAGDLSDEAYDALPWELQQAVLINKGSDGNPLYQLTPPSPEPAPAPEQEPQVAPVDLTIQPAPEAVPNEGAN